MYYLSVRHGDAARAKDTEIEQGTPVAEVEGLDTAYALMAHLGETAARELPNVEVDFDCCDLDGVGHTTRAKWHAVLAGETIGLPPETVTLLDCLAPAADEFLRGLELEVASRLEGQGPECGPPPAGTGEVEAGTGEPKAPATPQLPADEVIGQAAAPGPGITSDGNATEFSEPPWPEDSVEELCDFFGALPPEVRHRIRDEPARPDPAPQGTVPRAPGRLPPRYWLILEAMRELGAISEDKRKSEPEICKRYASSGGGLAKHPLVELKKLGYVNSLRQGSAGGYWLTEQALKSLQQRAAAD